MRTAVVTRVRTGPWRLAYPVTHAMKNSSLIDSTSPVCGGRVMIGDGRWEPVRAGRVSDVTCPDCLERRLIDVEGL